MSLPSQQDTTNPPLSAMPDTARKAHTPFKQRFQLLLAQIRFVFALPKIVVNLRNDLQQLVSAYEQLATQGLVETKMLNNVQQRLKYYEQNIPRMRDLRHDFENEQSGLKPKSNGRIELLSP